MAPALKPAYLIHGDDHGRIAQRRARLRELAQSVSGAQGQELFEGDRSTPERVAAALNTMTFAIGRRFVIVDGVERWKDKEMDPLVSAMAVMAPETTVAFFAREEGRLKAPARLHEAVRKAGGDIAAEQAVKPWELPHWAVTQACGLGLELTAEASRQLVMQVGERQQRLLRELEKLALELQATAQPGAATLVRVDVDEVLEMTAASAERRAWALADALLTGDAAAAIRMFLQIRLAGEKVTGLVYWIGTRVRQAHTIALALERGEPASKVRSGLRMPPSAADRLIADARRLGSERLRAAVCLVADLELASRGGGSAGASDDTEAVIVIRAISS
ncbi:MAG: DNA polymerase III subunit delta [Solirubrobacteraceae bacterium]